MNLSTTIAIAVYGVLVSGYALAQGSPLELRGFKLGMSVREAQTQLENIDRETLSAAKRKTQRRPRSLTCRESPNRTFGDKTCSIVLTVVNRSAFVDFLFFNDSLGFVSSKIHNRQISGHSAFDEIVEAMTEKYGLPDSAGTLPLTWRRGDQMMLVDKSQVSEGDEVVISMMSDSHVKESQRRKAQSAARNAKQL